MKIQKIKNIYHLFVAMLATILHGNPSKKIKVIAVTGTNGKTSTVQMIAQIIKGAGEKVAVSSTINFVIGKENWVNKTKLTTLSSWQVQKFIKRAVKEKCEYLVLETSSHAIDQNRIWGIDFDVAVITNITREHLDYHKTMDEYRKAKQKLFKKMSGKVVVVNLEMEKPADFLYKNAKTKYGYFIKDEDSSASENGLAKDIKKVFANEIGYHEDKTFFKIDGKPFELKLPGRFNVENALAAICVGLSQGLELEGMAEDLKGLKKIPGRMDYVENKLGLKIIIDYALTPDSMKKLGQIVEKIKQPQSKVIWVFGSCGERDKGKRPIMGEIVSGFADYCIVTNEDPYREDPQKIINEVFSGIKGKTEGENAWRIMERRRAIAKAIELGRKNDVILVTGKGAEENMAMGKRKIPWNDRRVIEEILAEK